MIHSIRPHKITSIVHRLDLGPVVDYTTDGIESRVGQVLVVRALEEKRVYDVVELTTGRMAHVAKGDVLVGALGRRDALRDHQRLIHRLDPQRGQPGQRIGRGVDAVVTAATVRAAGDDPHQRERDQGVPHARI